MSESDGRFCPEEEFKKLLLRTNMVLGNANVVQSFVPAKEGAPPPIRDRKRYMIDYVEFLELPEGLDALSVDTHYFHGQAAVMNAVRMHVLYESSKTATNGVFSGPALAVSVSL